MTDIYRVTRVRIFPTIKQSKTTIKICTKRSLSGQLKALQEARDHDAKYGRNTAANLGEIVKVERAPIGEFADVTDEFLAG